MNARRLVLRHHVRQISVDTTRPVVGGVHACARYRLIRVKQVLTLAETIEKHRHRTDIERVSPEPQAMIKDARNFVEHHADVLRAQRYFYAEQLLDRHHVRMFVRHHRHVVEPIHVRNRLDEGLVFGQLFGRAVQQTDVRVGALNHFTIEFKHQSQHAMRGWMLWSEIHCVISNLGHGSTFAEAFAVRVILLAHNAWHDFARLDGDRLVSHPLLVGVVAHLDITRQRKILAERMADKTVIGKDTAQIGMPGKHDAVEVERLALKPVGRRPYVNRRCDNRKFIINSKHAYPQTSIVRQAEQVINDSKMYAFAPAISTVINTTQVY